MSDEYPAYEPSQSALIEDLEDILVSEDSIRRRIVEIGKQLQTIYNGEEFVLISIVNGAVVFTADLMRAIANPVMLDCIHISKLQGRRAYLF